MNDNTAITLFLMIIAVFFILFVGEPDIADGIIYNLSDGKLND